MVTACVWRDGPRAGQDPRRPSGRIGAERSADAATPGVAPPRKNTMRRYRNLRNTGQRKCSCGTWFKHWRNETGSRRKRCAAYGCGNDAEVGAHVQSVRGKLQWIVPLCKPCNNLQEPFELELTVELISANTQLMGCYKKP